MLSRFCPESDNEIPRMMLDSIGGYYNQFPPECDGPLV